MPEKEPLIEKTYYFEGPVSFSSLTAQIFLKFGFVHAPRDHAEVLFSADQGERGISAVLSVRDGEIFRKESLRNREGTGHWLSDILSRMTGEPLGRWGYLTGMRPGKALYRLFDENGDSWKAAARIFLKERKVSDSIAELLIDTDARQYGLIAGVKDFEDKRKNISFYIHIPFCPSRCVYCSFPSAVCGRGEVPEEFMHLLLQDIASSASVVRECGLHAESIYIGGGTPVILSASQMDRVLRCIERELSPEPDCEFTVEAGRPDLMDEETLRLMADSGVGRISVNPQTMQDRILRAVRRYHRGTDVEHAVSLARKCGFSVINMDFIAGLPYQTAADMEENMDAVCNMKPENVTIHTLAVKRGSLFRGREKEFSLPGEDEVAAMVRTAHERLRSGGMEPYYLYRQKYMREDFANVGYALPGTECIYNIQMIGERQTVIGAGPGSVTKAVRGSSFRLDKFYMPHDIVSYGKNFHELTEKRNRLIRNYFERV